MRNKLRRLNREMTAFKVVTMVNSIMLSLLLIWSFTKPHGDAGATTMTAGSVATNLSVNGNEAATNRAETDYKAAKRRGYFTASEYARFECVSLETVYRHANGGKIEGAELVGGRWRIPLPDD